jgi:hypothetical protein
MLPRLCQLRLASYSAQLTETKDVTLPDTLVKTSMPKDTREAFVPTSFRAH